MPSAALFTGRSGSRRHQFDVSLEKLDGFVRRLGTVRDDETFDAFVTAYGIRRSDARFWPLSDRHTARAIRENPIAAGAFDLNRYDDY